jgi:tetratricopeptide (TPR) repeat protein
VQSHLSQDGAGQWLLIVDNIDDIEIWDTELKAYLPKSQQGCVVCTTRSREIAVKIAAPNVIEVPELDEEMAMQLLAKLLINETLLTSRDDAQKLLEQLTFLPLAIVQAAAYINGKGIALSVYLSLLAEQEQDVIDLLSEDFEDEGRYQDVKNPVATTWLISFEHIRRLNPLAVEYLSFMSCLVPKDIPQLLLPPGPSKKKETDAIGTLNAYSFVSKRAADNALDVHRLVHLVTRNWLRMQKQQCVWVNRALTRLVEVVPLGDHEQKGAWTAYLPHAVHVVKLCEIYAKDAEVSLQDRIGRCEQRLGRYKAAERAHLQLLRKRKDILGHEHVDTITSRNRLGLAILSQGKFVEAEHMYQAILASAEEVLGREHPETLISMHNLAVALSSQGKYAEAETMHRETRALIEEALGKKHPSTLASMSNLAGVLSSQGKYAEAETMHRERWR